MVTAAESYVYVPPPVGQQAPVVRGCIEQKVRDVCMRRFVDINTIPEISKEVFATIDVQGRVSEKADDFAEKFFRPDVPPFGSSASHDFVMDISMVARTAIDVYSPASADAVYPLIGMTSATMMITALSGAFKALHSMASAFVMNDQDAVKVALLDLSIRIATLMDGMAYFILRILSVLKEFGRIEIVSWIASSFYWIINAIMALKEGWEYYKTSLIARELQTVSAENFLNAQLKKECDENLPWEEAKKIGAIVLLRYLERLSVDGVSIEHAEQIFADKCKGQELRVAGIFQRAIQQKKNEEVLVRRIGERAVALLKTGKKEEALAAIQEKKNGHLQVALLGLAAIGSTIAAIFNPIGTLLMLFICGGGWLFLDGKDFLAMLRTGVPGKHDLKLLCVSLVLAVAATILSFVLFTNPVTAALAVVGLVWIAIKVGVIWRMRRNELIYRPTMKSWTDMLLKRSGAQPWHELRAVFERLPKECQKSFKACLGSKLLQKFEGENLDVGERNKLYTKFKNSWMVEQNSRLAHIRKNVGARAD